MTRDRSNVTALLDEAPSYSRQNQGGIFVVIKGPDRGEAVRLTGEPVSFGSGPQCSLVLTDKTVSRKHLEAQLSDDEVLMIDCGSTNGSFIQGSRFEKISIGFGAEVKLGRTVIKFLPDEEVVEPEPSAQMSFGSIIGETGLPGEADYALANEWLALRIDRFAREHPACLQNAPPMAQSASSTLNRSRPIRSTGRIATRMRRSKLLSFSTMSRSSANG